MAISEYYVDPGSGNDTTGNGTIGTPWATVQHALDTITRDATNGDRINVKAGTSDTLGAALTLATYGTPTGAAPLVIQGYTSAAGDGGIGEISGANTYSIYDSNANTNKDAVHFWDMKIGNCGAAVVVRFYRYSSLVNCEVYGSSANPGVRMEQAQDRIVGCLFHSLTGTSNVTLSSSTIVIGCTFRSSGGTQVILNSADSVIAHCVFDIDTDTSLTAISSQNGTGSFFNNTIYSSSANTSAGIIIAGTGLSAAVCLNNLITGYSGAGGLGLTNTTAPVGIVGGNAYYNNTTSMSLSATAVATLKAGIDLGSNPFVDAANDDFNLVGGSTALEAAWPAAMKGMANTTNLADIGAVQAGAGAGGGGGPVIGSRIIRGLGAV